MTGPTPGEKPKCPCGQTLSAKTGEPHLFCPCGRAWDTRRLDLSGGRTGKLERRCAECGRPYARTPVAGELPNGLEAFCRQCEAVLPAGHHETAAFGVVMMALAQYAHHARRVDLAAVHESLDKIEIALHGQRAEAFLRSFLDDPCDADTINGIVLETLVPALQTLMGLQAPAPPFVSTEAVGDAQLTLAVLRESLERVAEPDGAALLDTRDQLLAWLIKAEERLTQYRFLSEHTS